MNKPHIATKPDEATLRKSPAPSHNEPVLKQVLEPAPQQNPKETAQEAVHEVMPKAIAKDLLKPDAANDVVNVTPKAAKGDDDLMSKQEKKS